MLRAYNITIWGLCGDSSATFMECCGRDSESYGLCFEICDAITYRTSEGLVRFRTMTDTEETHGMLAFFDSNDRMSLEQAITAVTGAPRAVLCGIRNGELDFSDADDTGISDRWCEFSRSEGIPSFEFALGVSGDHSAPFLALARKLTRSPGLQFMHPLEKVPLNLEMSVPPRLLASALRGFAQCVPVLVPVAPAPAAPAPTAPKPVSAPKPAPTAPKPVSAPKPAPTAPKPAPAAPVTRAPVPPVARAHRAPWVHRGYSSVTFEKEYAATRCDYDDLVAHVRDDFEDDLEEALNWGYLATFAVTIVSTREPVWGGGPWADCDSVSFGRKFKVQGCYDCLDELLREFAEDRLLEFRLLGFTSTVRIVATFDLA